MGQEPASGKAASPGTGGMSRHLLATVAVSEACTGLALLFVPSLVGQLLFGVAFAPATIAVARVAGIALIAFGIACWPGPAVAGMIAYSSGVALYLGYLGIANDMAGPLIWPAVALQFVIAVLLARPLAART